MLFTVYLVIVALLTVILFKEIFTEKDWRKQIAIAMVMLVFILRIFQIK